MACNSSEAKKLADYRKKWIKAARPATRWEYFLPVVLSGEIKIKGQSNKPLWLPPLQGQNFPEDNNKFASNFCCEVEVDTILQKN